MLHKTRGKGNQTKRRTFFNKLLGLLPANQARKKSANVDPGHFTRFGGFERLCNLSGMTLYDGPVCGRQNENGKRSTHKLTFRFHPLVVCDESVELAGSDRRRQLSVLDTLQAELTHGLDIVTTQKADQRFRDTRD